MVCQPVLGSFMPYIYIFLEVFSFFFNTIEYKWFLTDLFEP